MSPSFTAIKAMPFAQSIIDPPPMAITISQLSDLAKAAPSKAVVVNGLASTWSKRTCSIWVASSFATTRSYKPDFFALVRPVTISAFLPYGAAKPAILSTLFQPNWMFTGKK